MKLYRVIIPVSSIEKATEFYGEILNMEGNRVSNGRHYFNCGGTILACFDPNADGDNFEPKPNPDHIYISVSNLEHIYNKFRDSYCSFIEDSITTQPWGEKTFYVKDPFGNPICFVDEKTVFIG
ncbi:VOC family protein [Sutcliffiella deserti]|uniref:VOC family protein n=1 Tax=Sutcliffiella deserti TaxID=2875501 RepID=UPI001CC06BC0|nr:VOC family protein [Sutcliffiella deserti]